MKALVCTRKAVHLVQRKGTAWKILKSHFEGVKASAAYFDKAKKKIWVGLNHGHWGPKLHVSSDGGKTFTEIAVPKFPEGSGDALKDIWVIKRDHGGRLFVGVEPATLFYSDDEGATWTLCADLDKKRKDDKWFSGGTDGSCVHSIVFDPRKPERIGIGISIAGFLVSDDRGKTWRYANKGLRADYMPDPTSDTAQDAHFVVNSPSNPDVIWQQNHCGIFKSENFGETWIDLSKAKGLVSAFGWGIAVDEADPLEAYTIPALSDAVRVPVKHRLVVQKTVNGGKTWKPLTKGLPDDNCYDIVYRNAFVKSGKNLFFGSTTGNVYFSGNKGDSWKKLPWQLAPIFAVEIAD